MCSSDLEGKFVAIKMHFGELGNLAYLFGRPLVSIYAPGEEEVIRQALIRMSFICCPYLLGGFRDTMVGGLRGIGAAEGALCPVAAGETDFSLLRFYAP